MNKTYLISIGIILFMLISLPLFSQAEKGKFLIGGNCDLDFSSDKRTAIGANYNFEMERNRNIEFSPFFGYEVLKNLSPGIKLDYMFHKNLSPSGLGYNNWYSSHSLLIVPSLRYYLFNFKIRPFLQAGYGFGWEKQLESHFQTPLLEYNNKLSEWELSGGVSFSISRNLSFELVCGYSSLTVHYINDLVDGANENWDQVITGPDASVGITLFL